MALRYLALDGWGPAGNYWTMPCKFLSLSIVVLLAASAQAGTKLVPLTSDPGGATLGVYDPDPLVRPTGTAVVICNSGKSQALEQAILGDLGKAGCAGFLLQKSPSPLTSADVARAFDYLQAHAAEYHLRPASGKNLKFLELFSLFCPGLFRAKSQVSDSEQFNNLTN